jgi:hypothetical protein
MIGVQRHRSKSRWLSSATTAIHIVVNIKAHEMLHGKERARRFRLMMLNRTKSCNALVLESMTRRSPGEGKVQSGSQ